MVTIENRLADNSITVSSKNRSSSNIVLRRSYVPFMHEDIVAIIACGNCNYKNKESFSLPVTHTVRKEHKEFICPSCDSKDSIIVEYKAY